MCVVSMAGMVYHLLTITICTVIAFLGFEHLVLILPASLQIIYGSLHLQLAHDYTIYHIMPQRVSE